MRFTTSLFTMLFGAALVLAGSVNTAQAQSLFSDNFENRVVDQALIDNGWTAYDQSFSTDTCIGDPTSAFGPLAAENRNFVTAGGNDSYFRAGLEVPAWDGALTNMLRVYGNQYNGNPTCQRVLVFQDYPNVAPGNYTFSFDVAKDRYGAPANGEIIGAFVKVLKSSDNSYAELIFTTLASAPPAATSPQDVTTATQSINFTVPVEMAGELLQFGFYNDVAPSLGQSWTTSGAYYDNIDLSPAAVVPPPGGEYGGEALGVPVPFWAYIAIIGLLLFMGGSALRNRKNKA